MFSISTYSQATPLPGGAAAGPTEVTVEVAAHDKKGNTVSDLTPADVEVFDGGVAVSLTSLRLAGETQETIAFVFDQAVPGVLKMDRDLAEKLLAAVAGHGYRFMVFKIENRLHLVQAPTTDVDVAKNAIEAATMASRADYVKATEAAEQKMTEDTDMATGERQATARMLLAMLLDSQKIAETDARSTPSVAALLALSRGQESVPGRKAIVYFSQGLDWQKNSPETLRTVMQAANRERASLYAFDADIGDVQAGNAMIAGAALAAEGQRGNITAAQTDAAGTATVATEFANRMNSGEGAINTVKSLAAICQRTGGLHVSAMGSDGRRGVTEVAMDLTSYYLASWISPASGDDNRLRPILVKPLRKGIVLESRAGYYPMRGGNVAKVSAREATLVAALAAPALPSNLPLTAALLRYGNTPDNTVNSVVVQVPVDPAETSGGRDLVSVLMQLKDKSGAVVEKFSADISPRRTAGEPAQPAQDVVSFRRQFNAPPGEYVLESAAMDSSGGKIGAQRDNVVIPAVTKGLALGDVLLVRRIDPPGAGDENDPLRCVKGIEVPNLSGRISKSGSPRVDLFFDIHMDPASNDAAVLSAELWRGEDPIAKLPLKVAADPTRPTFPYMTTLGVGSLSAGKYRMTIVLSQGGQNVSKSAAFTLE